MLAVEGATLAAQQRPPAPRPREAAVLTVLRQLDPLDKPWLATSSFAPGRTAGGLPEVVPHIPISCGNSRMGACDPLRARALARELFAAYGLEAKAEVALRQGSVDAVLDGYDAARKLGFVLRGIVPLAHPMGELATDRRAADLDSAELANLQVAGVRVHSVELRDYPLMDGDQYTPTLAYLAGVVAFLDEVTDGEDVPLAAVLWQHAQRFPLGAVEPRDGLHVTPGPAGMSLLHVVEADAVLTFAIDGDGVEERAAATPHRAREWSPLKRPIPTAGRPTRVTLGASSEKPGTMRVEQRLGERTVVGEAVGMSVLMPGEFDAGKPFQVVLKLAPGLHHVQGHVVVGCSRQ